MALRARHGRGTRRRSGDRGAGIVGYSRLTVADEDRTLARLRTLRSDLIDRTISANNGRVFKRTGDGVLVEFRSVVDAVREVQKAMVPRRRRGARYGRRIVFRIGIHLGDVVEEAERRSRMGDDVNIATRLERIAKPGAICLSEGRVSSGQRAARSR